MSSREASSTKGSDRRRKSSPTPSSSWSVQDLEKIVQQAVEKHAKGEELAMQENPKLPFDPTVEPTAAYVQEWKDCGTRPAKERASSPVREEQRRGRGSSAPPATETAMTAWDLTTALPWEGRWKTPNHIPKLSHVTVDYDWWFRQMREHLDECRFTHQSELIRHYRIHCDRDFWAEVRDKLKTDEVDPSKVMTHPHKFQEYVCFRFTKPTYPNEVMGRLLALKEKGMEPTAAWLETSKLVFCYNEFMRRRQGVLLTDLQHAYHFAHALKPAVRAYIYDLLEQRHPKVRTARGAYGAAVSHVQGREEIRKGGKDDEEEEPMDQVMTATATATRAEKRKAVRRGKGSVKKERKEAAMVAVGKEATGAAAQRPSSAASTAASPSGGSSSGASTGSAVAPPPPPTTPTKSAAGSFAAASSHGASKWTPPPGTNCNYCHATDHWMANCPHRPQYRGGRGGGRPPMRRHKPCPYCGRMNHPGERCWQEFPHLRPSPMQNRVTTPNTTAVRPQQANFAAAGVGGAEGGRDAQGGPQGGEVVALATGAVAAGMTAMKWDHVAESGGHRETAFVSAPAQGLSEEMTAVLQVSGDATHHAATLDQDGPATRSRFADGDSPKYALLAPREPPEGLSQLSLCRCLLKVETEYGGRPFRMVIDTGATVNLVRRDRLEVTAEPVDVPPVPVTTVTGATEYMRQMVTLLFELNAYPYVFDLFVTEKLPADALLGIDAIVEAGWIIDVFRRCMYHLTHAIPPVPMAPCPHTVTLAYAVAEFVLPPRAWRRISVRPEPHASATNDTVLLLMTPSPPSHLTVHSAPVVMEMNDPSPCVLLCNYGTQSLCVEKGSPLAYREVCIVAVAAETAEQTPTSRKRREKGKQLRVNDVFDLAQAQANWPGGAVECLKQMLVKWRHVWDAQEIVGRTNKWEHRLETGTAQPIALPLRRIAWLERDMIREEVDKMKAQKVVVESDSPWSSPPVLVKKKDGTVRFCIDYRKLNEVTVPDQYPLPRIDDVLDALEHGRYFSVIDLKSGYWQIPMRDSDAAKTAFRTADGLFQFTVMPFGLRNAPATFQRLMDVVFSGLKWQGILVYLDDIIVYSADEERHLLLLEQVLQRLSEAGLKLNPKKTTLVSREVNYLGHVVSADGVRPDPKKIKAVMQLSPPTSVREVRSFLGLAGYYRRFIDGFAAMATPLYSLTKKGTTFAWGEKQQAAFDGLKRLLCTSPILAYPRRDRVFVLDCDASDEAAGAVLTQLDEEGKEIVVQYASYTFTGAEQRWPIMEKEAYAVVWAINVFRSYLLGRKFTVRTDNSATFLFEAGTTAQVAALGCGAVRVHVRSAAPAREAALARGCAVAAASRWRERGGL